MNPELWLEKRFSGEFFTGRFEHISQIIKKLNLAPNKSTKIVTIGGTNGKGQTARILAQLLSLASCRYTLWTSPHLRCVTERFSSNSNNIPASDLIKIFNQMDKELERIKVDVSYFEFLFLCFLKFSQGQLPQYMILEVGLGGRLDATNTIDADITVITSISRDHQDILGNRYEDILLEKMGITRKNRRCITAFELKYLRQKSSEYAKENNVDIYDLFEMKMIEPSDNFSQRNAKLARYTFSKICTEQVLKQMSIELKPSREEIKIDGALFSLFPSHNVDGLRKLIQLLSEDMYTKYDLVLLSFSSRSFKDLVCMCSIMKRYVKSENIRLLHFNHSKAIDELTLQQISNETGINICVDINKTIKNSIVSQKNTLVTGSNYFLGDFSKRIQ